MAVQKATANHHIRWWDLWRVFWRSFFIQSLWNYRSLISIGFGVCLLPVLRRLYKSEADRREFLKRHLKFFNAHPYMVSYALGVSIRLEEEYANGHPEATQKLERMKDLLISILGSIGDRLFWLTLRPASLLFGVAGVFIFNSLTARSCVLILSFLLYNIPHFYMRYRGIVEGYQFSTEVYRCFQSNRIHRLQQLFQYLGTIALAIFFVSLLFRFGFFQNPHLFVLLGSVVVNMFLTRFVKNFYFTLLINILFFVILGITIHEL